MHFEFKRGKSENFYAPISFSMGILSIESIESSLIMMTFTNTLGSRVLSTKGVLSIYQGKTSYSLTINNHNLTPGKYEIGLSISYSNELHLNYENVMSIEISRSCPDMPLIHPHINRGRDKIGTFQNIIVEDFCHESAKAVREEK